MYVQLPSMVGYDVNGATEVINSRDFFHLLLYNKDVSIRKSGNKYLIHILIHLTIVLFNKSLYLGYFMIVFPLFYVDTGP